MANSDEKRNPNGRWKKGISGNKAGRPVGSRNYAALLIEQLLEGEAEALIRKAIELGKNGNIQALRFCLELLVPVRRERSVELEIRPSENGEDVPLNFRDILENVAQGRITPAEGESLANILTNHLRTLEAAELDRRVQALEETAREDEERSKQPLPAPPNPERQRKRPN